MAEILTPEQSEVVLSGIREYLALSPLERPKSAVVDIVMAHAECALASMLKQLSKADAWQEKIDVLNILIGHHNAAMDAWEHTEHKLYAANLIIDDKERLEVGLLKRLEFRQSELDHMCVYAGDLEKRLEVAKKVLTMADKLMPNDWSLSPSNKITRSDVAAYWAARKEIK